MFTFGIVMCFISAAIYGVVVYSQIQRIDRLEGQMTIVVDRIDLQRQRTQGHNAWLQNLTQVNNGLMKRFREIEPSTFPVQMTAVSDLDIGDVQNFTVDVFAPPVEQSAEVA